MPLARIERQVQAARADARACDEVGEVVVDTELRVLQVDGLDRMAGHGYVDARVRDDRLVTEADHAREPPAGPPFLDSIQVDEAYGLARTVRMRHAGPEPAPDEDQVGIGIARLDRAPGGVEVQPALPSVVRGG